MQERDFYIRQSKEFVQARLNSQEMNQTKQGLAGYMWARGTDMVPIDAALNNISILAESRGNVYPNFISQFEQKIKPINEEEAKTVAYYLDKKIELFGEQIYHQNSRELLREAIRTGKETRISEEDIEVMLDANLITGAQGNAPKWNKSGFAAHKDYMDEVFKAAKSQIERKLIQSIIDLANTKLPSDQQIRQPHNVRIGGGSDDYVISTKGGGDDYVRVEPQVVNAPQSAPLAGADQAGAVVAAPRVINRNGGVGEGRGVNEAEARKGTQGEGAGETEEEIVAGEVPEGGFEEVEEEDSGLRKRTAISQEQIDESRVALNQARQEYAKAKNDLRGWTGFFRKMFRNKQSEERMVAARQKYQNAAAVAAALEGMQVSHSKPEFEYLDESEEALRDYRCDVLCESLKKLVKEENNLRDSEISVRGTKRFGRLDIAMHNQPLLRAALGIGVNAAAVGAGLATGAWVVPAYVGLAAGTVGLEGAMHLNSNRQIEDQFLLGEITTNDEKNEQIINGIDQKLERKDLINRIAYMHEHEVMSGKTLKDGVREALRIPLVYKLQRDLRDLMNQDPQIGRDENVTANTLINILASSDEIKYLHLSKEGRLVQNMYNGRGRWLTAFGLSTLFNGLLYRTSPRI